MFINVLAKLVNNSGFCILSYPVYAIREIRLEGSTQNGIKRNFKPTF